MCHLYNRILSGTTIPKESMIKKIIQLPDPPSFAFTQQKYDSLLLEQAELLAEEKDVLVRLQTAREMGDLSENGAYKYAKFELGNVRRQLKTINHLVKYGHVQTNTSGGKIGFGSTVT